MEPKRIDQDDVKKAIQSVYMHPNQQKEVFINVIEEVSYDDSYQVTDPNEEKQLMKALEEDNPILSETEIKRLLKN